MLKTLQSEFRAPVDLEFAHDGTDLYLLQCRLQSYSAKSAAGVDPERCAERPDPFFGQPVCHQRDHSRT